MHIEHINIAELKPYDKNAKKHPQKQIDLLADNITRFGFTTPILVDKDNNVIAGHGRLLALKKLRKDNAPCVRMEHLTEDEVKALRLADNKIAELGEWDMDLAVGELKELDTDLLELTGFDKDLIIEPDEKDDEVPEVPTAPQSKLGDLYELGNHRVLCGDSTKIEDVERLMDGKKADMVFTDPPYGMNLDADYEGMSERSTKVKGKKYSNVIGDEKDFDPRFLIEYFKDAKEQLWWGADYYYNYLPPHGSWMVWIKRNENMTDIIGNHFEVCWSSEKHKRKAIFKIWSGVTARNREFARAHPTEKPISLNAELITECSGENDIIADLFLGSGSTLIASEKTGRICFGMEIDERYCDVIVQRYVDYTGNENIFKNGEPITWNKSE